MNTDKYFNFDFNIEIKIINKNRFKKFLINYTILKLNSYLC